MRHKLQARLHHMAAGELLAMVDADTLTRIREKDEHPELRAYAIAHEGAAKGKAIGIGEVVMQYARDMIAKLGAKLRVGTQLFLGHGETNDHAGRKAIGEVVGKAAQQIDGKAAQVAAVWIYPEYREQRLDVASIEADIEFSYDGQGSGKALDVGEITGIALGDSEHETPGFPGATLLATVQAFVQGDDTTMTKEELQQAIKEAGYAPSDLFGRDALTEDSAVTAAIKEAVDKETKTERTAKQEIQKRLGEKLDNANKRLSELERETVRHKTGSVFQDLAKQRNLTEAQLKFIERRLETFDAEADNEEELKSALNAHLDGELKAFDDYAEVFGAKGGDSKDDKDAPADDETPNGDGADFTDPANNEFIPQ